MLNWQASKNPNPYLKVLQLLLLVGLAILPGIASYFLGIYVLVAGIGLIGIATVIVLGSKLWNLYAFFLLVGYMFLSRGFAGFGVYPIYVSELGLMLGFLTLALLPFSINIRIVNIKRFYQPEILILIFFIISQVLQTLPYIAEYRFDALRDAMTYAYAFYLILLLALTPNSYIKSAFRIYARIAPFLLLWGPFFYLNSKLELTPYFFTKGADLAFHLSGIGSFMILQLDKDVGEPWPDWQRWICWVLWIANLAALGALSRGAMTGMIVAVGMTVVMRPLRLGWLRPFTLGIVVLAVLVASNLYTAEINLGTDRTFSIEQYVDNVASIFGEGDDTSGALEGTKQFRLQWWTDIINYTFNGEYFWTGKGYGINLANADGHQLGEEETLRSPHNGHFTILGRSGVPGFLLWVALLIVFAIRLFSAGLTLTHPKKNSTRGKGKFAILFLAMYLSAFIQISVDVYLEGPMGGIWFWILMGLGLIYFSEGFDFSDNAEKQGKIDNLKPRKVN